MSYTRTFSKTISIDYSGSVSYQKSESGGTAYYSGTATETVYVNIEVDTNAFDSSVEACNSNINLLTGCVVATETAQGAAIRSNANKVADTIVQGFFKTIRSDISQQISELRAHLEANLAHLR